jgi:dCMP deaminase
MTDWTRRHFELALHVAGWSKDPDTRVGAVLIGIDPRDIAVAYNGFPKGIADTSGRLNDRTFKRKLAQHAERNALDNARFSCEGATLATTMFPCIECAKSMINKGVGRLITPRPPKPLAGPSWRDDCQLALQLLEEKGVEVFWMDIL